MTWTAMQISVKFFGSLRTIFGTDAITLSLEAGSTVADLLSELGRMGYTTDAVPDDYSWRHGSPAVTVLWGRKSVLPREAGQILLNEGDTVTLVPPLAGGTD